MNKRTQLLEVIAALPEELVDQALNYVQMLQNPIQITPGVCGGKARIRNTRIPVWTLVAYRQEGSPDEELLANYPGLTLMDTHQETEYVLGNSHLMQQINQFKHNSQKSHSNQPIHSIDFDYILNNPELIPQIQLLIETHKQKHHAINRIS